MKYYYGRHIQDGYLGLNCGRAVIYRGNILHANGPSADHNYLLISLAARIVEDKHKVLSEASRFYFMRDNGDIIISPVRKIDDDDFERNRELYISLFKKVLR